MGLACVSQTRARTRHFRQLIEPQLGNAFGAAEQQEVWIRCVRTAGEAQTKPCFLFKQDRKCQTGSVWACFTSRRSLYFPRHWEGGLFLANTSMNAAVSSSALGSPHPHGLVVWQQQRQRRNVCRTTWHTYESVKELCCHCVKSQRVHAALCLLCVYFSGPGLVNVTLLRTQTLHSVTYNWLPVFTKVS